MKAQGLLYPTLTADIAAATDAPVSLQAGDSIPAACIENAARLRDCNERHKQAVKSCQPL